MNHMHFLNQLILLIWKRVHLVTEILKTTASPLHLVEDPRHTTVVYNAKRLSHQLNILNNDDKWKTDTYSAGFWTWSDWPDLSDLRPVLRSKFNIPRVSFHYLASLSLTTKQSHDSDYQLGK